jgi:hypothetical protein
VLSTLLNDSLYIVKMKLAEEDDKYPLEMIIETDKENLISYNIENHFIYGVAVKKDKLSAGRNIALNSLQYLKGQLKDVITWIETEAQ